MSQKAFASGETNFAIVSIAKTKYIAPARLC